MSFIEPKMKKQKKSSTYKYRLTYMVKLTGQQIMIKYTVSNSIYKRKKNRII